MCILVQPFSNGAEVRPGHTASYAIFVWSIRATSRNVAVIIAVGPAKHVSGPAFTVCPDRGGAACYLGDIPARQTEELQASVKVRPGATAGEHVRLNAEAQATGSASERSSATFVVIAAATSPSPIDTLPPLTLPQAVITPTNPSGLFPTVSPQPTASPGTVLARPRHRGGRVKVATDAATLPLSTRLIGGQLAGLAVLAGAIAMAIARLSLRTQRPQGAQRPQGGGEKPK